MEAVTTERQLLDLGPQGHSLGDQIVFTSRLLRGQTEVGHQGVEGEIRVQPDPSGTRGILTFHLKD